MVGEQTESGMSLHAGTKTYQNLSCSPERQVAPRSGYVLMVSGVLAAVTFTLVYLTTLSYATF